jgi:hypothetical protein
MQTPEVKERAAQIKISSGLYTGGPGVAVDTASGAKPPAPKQPEPIIINLKDVSLLEAFNSVARSFGHTMWIYTETECGGKTTYTITTGKN